MSSTAPRPGKLRAFWLGLAGVALAVFFYSPVRELAGVNLDGANHSSYAWFTAHHFQYGSQVVPMAGPYGFVLYGWTYAGELFWTRALGQLVLQGGFAALALWFFRSRRPTPFAWLWLAALVAFTPFHDDLPIEWSLLLGGWFLVTERTRRGWSLAVTVLLAYLSLIKGTQLALGFATVGVALGLYAWRRDWRHVATLAAGYGAGLLGLWLLAGQNPLHLPGYFRATLDLAAGYNDAMTLDGPPDLLHRGLMVAALLAAGLALALWSRRRDAVAVATLLLAAGHTFVQWKHGFVRADGHAYIYFHFALAAAIALLLLAWPAATERRTPFYALLALAAAVWLATLTGPRDAKLPDLPGTPARVVRRLADNLRQLTSLPAVKSGYDLQFEAQRQLNTMPLTKRAVGNGRVDVFGYEHNRATLNRLNYTPRPMGGGQFNAYTPALMQRNADFLRDAARRPDFQLVRLETIDGRFLAQDDGLVLQALPYLYRPVLVEQNHLLLAAIPSAQLPPPRPVGQLRSQIGETVPVPAVAPGEVLLVRFDVKLTWLGRLLNAVYKLPRLRLALGGVDSGPEPHRLVRVMAASPFVLNPVLGSTTDLLQLYAGEPGLVPRDLRVSTADRTWFQREIGIEFTALPRPPAVPAGTDLAMLQRLVRTPCETVDTVDAATGTAVHVFAQVAHAPSELSWTLDGRERTVRFGYGLVPAAYDKTTDGVEFTAWLARAGEAPVAVFRTFLSPHEIPAHRGHRHAEFPLPEHPAGSRFLITSGPGPHQNNAFDWAYISELDFPDAPEPAASSR